MLATVYSRAQFVEDSSAIVRLRVARARDKRLERQGLLNSALSACDLERYALPDRETCDLLQFTARRFRLSARLRLVLTGGAHDRGSCECEGHYRSSRERGAPLSPARREGLDSAARAAPYGRRTLSALAPPRAAINCY